MLKEMAEKARAASIKIAKLNTEEKNKILLAMTNKIDNNRDAILESNKIDVQANQGHPLIDRLILNNKRLDLVIDSLKQLAKLKDYVGEVINERTLKNSLKLVEKRVGFGVVGVIYESRPNVTVDVCGICLKSSSAVILKGGKEALNTNKVLVKLLSEACPIENAFQLIESTDRSVVNELLQLKGYIDLVIPRGGEGLINFVRDNSKIPVIETGTGNCHIYVDNEIDINQAIKIIVNAKTQRPSVCNAAEKVLIHKDIAKELLPKLKEALVDVEIRGCEKTKEIIDCRKATEEDWRTEFLDLVIGIKIVNNIDEAIQHINKYSSKHTEAILSKNQDNIDKFFNQIDSAVIFSNASTRFTDGHEFGLGTEIGISTQKMHARGPMGLKALTTTKYLITGTGQIRK